MKIGFKSADLLLPNKEIDMGKWSVVACDQYTSEPEYWRDVENIVGGAPSALKITLPEVYLGTAGVDEKISKINSTMEEYLANGTLTPYGDTYIYVERTLADGKVRKGLMGIVDLEEYDYNKGSQSLIRATEGTVLERIPPRVKVRENASIEIPHIMLLIDDEQNSVLSTCENVKTTMQVAYDFKMMKQSGSIKGYFVPKIVANKINEALENLAKPEVFEAKYDVKDKGVLLFAVGDGNHSLATAKECYERIKAKTTKEVYENHPARYAMVEVVNVHDTALEFEPIHRVVFEVEPEDLIKSLETAFDVSYEKCEGQKITFITKDKKADIYIKNPTSNLPVGTLQGFLDKYTSEKGGKVDYIHGDDVTENLAKQEGNIGFLLPSMAKSDLFKTVVLDGSLPRKTFSMGHACDKRFYLEARKIK